MYYRNNIDSTLTLCEVMNEHNVKNIVFSSSATAYGVLRRVYLLKKTLMLLMLLILMVKLKL